MPSGANIVTIYIFYNMAFNVSSTNFSGTKTMLTIMKFPESLLKPT